MDTWYLWGFFSDHGHLIITRGRTQYEAEIWAAHNAKCDVRGLPFLPINAASAYGLNHPFDWMNTPPQWTGWVA